MLERHGQMLALACRDSTVGDFSKQ